MEDTYKGQVDNPLSLNRYTYVENNPLSFIDSTGHWSTEVTANWSINETKWKWAEATSKSDKAYWSGRADQIRNQLRKNGVSEQDIMKSTDNMIPEDMVNSIAWEHTVSAIENDPTGLGFLAWSSDKMLYLSPGGLGALTVKDVSTGFIKHSVWNQMSKKIGKKGLDVFVKAMGKGFVRNQGEEGIKRLTGQGTKINGTLYQYELKNLSKEFGDYRVFGNWDEKSKKVVFTYFDKHQ
jgi:hypothetical protein